MDSSLIYLDTNIFLDFLLGRKNISGRDIGKHSGNLLVHSLKCKFRIAVSTWTLQELKDHIDLDSARMTFSLLKKKIITDSHDEEDVREAKKMSPDHYQDALHVILAKRMNASCIVTRNIVDFSQYSKLIEIKLPEQL